MYLLYKFTRGFIKSLVSSCAPWQIAVGAFLGALLGFLPLWPLTQGPNPIWFLVLTAAFLINCHVGSVFLFFALGKLLAKLLAGPAVVIGMGMEGFARTAADTPFLYWSLLSHSGYLGLTVIGSLFAVVSAVLMWFFARWFQTVVKARIAANARLAKAGKLADRPFLVRIGCWFMGL